MTWSTAESFGDPDRRFTGQLGFQCLIDVHRHLKFTDEQRDRFITLSADSLDEAGLPDDERFRRPVPSHLEFGTQVAAA